MNSNNRRIDLKQVKTDKEKYRQSFTVQNPNNSYCFMDRVPSDISVMLVTDGQVEYENGAYQVKSATFTAIVKEFVKWVNDTPSRCMQEINVISSSRNPSLQGRFYLLG